MKGKVSVILNCYKRPDTLNQQIAALEAQSVAPHEILIWQNKGNLEDFQPIQPVLHNHASAVSNFNWGVWSRFAYALNSTGDYICLFDDDTIPGENWLENCLVNHSRQRGVYGTIGVVFHDLDYRNYKRYGWAEPNEHAQEVDIVGHSWFFDREVLGKFWSEAPVPQHELSGEDVHLSYSAQKLGLNTYVPPHPRDDLSLWGSQPNEAMQYGIDDVAISCNYHGSHFGANLKHYHKKGMCFQKIARHPDFVSDEEKAKQADHNRIAPGFHLGAKPELVKAWKDVPA
jgi:glycosyltransferase involved in cell wall biosynthesis